MAEEPLFTTSIAWNEKPPHYQVTLKRRRDVPGELGIFNWTTGGEWSSRTYTREEVRAWDRYTWPGARWKAYRVKRRAMKQLRRWSRTKRRVDKLRARVQG